MHILVFEPVSSGHHMALYLRLFARAAKREGWKITLITNPDALAHPAFDLVRREGADIETLLTENISRPDQDGSLHLLRAQYIHFSAVRNALDSLKSGARPDVALVLNLSHFDKIAALFGSPFGDIPWMGILVSAKFHRHSLGIGPKSRNDLVFKYLFARMLQISTLRCVGVIDEVFFAYANSTRMRSSEKLFFLPDVGQVGGDEPRDEARRRLGIPPGSFVILVYGSLSRRKGIQELLAAVRDPAIPDHVVVHLAGKQDASVEGHLGDPMNSEAIATGRVRVSPYFHDADSECRVFKAADAVWVGYVGEAYGSSGVLYQACSLGLPVIATSMGSIGRIVETHRVGPVINPSEHSKVVACVAELSINQNAREYYSRNALALSEKHTEKTFMDALVEQVQVAALV